MEMEKIFVSSKVVDIAEDASGALTLKNRVCYYGEPNLNGVKLPYDDTSLEFAQTLVDMPVYAHYIIDSEGKPTFTGHEMKIDPVSGEVKFGTEPIGVHTAVEIKNDLVEVNGVTKSLPCLFADQKIWTRNKNAVAATKRLYEEGRLHTSWEICSQEYTFADGIKTISKYYFEGNTFLGTSQPAYGKSAKVLSLASVEEGQLMVAEALSQDLVENGESSVEKEVKNLDIEEKIEVETSEQAVEETEAVVETVEASEEVVEEQKQEVSEEAAEETVAEEETVEQEAEQDVPAEEAEAEQVSEVETSSLTTEDLYNALRECLYKNGGRGHIVSLFPEDHELWVHKYDDKELDMILYHYTVSGDEVAIDEGTPVTLVVSLRSVNEQIKSLNQQIQEKDGQIADAAEKVAELSSQIEVLSEYKRKADEAEIAEKQAALLDKCKKTNLFEESELAEGEIAKMISELDEAGVKAAIADRFMSSLESKASVEVSEKKVAYDIAKMDIGSASIENSVAEFRRAFLKK